MNIRPDLGLISRIAAELEEYRDDEKAFWDTLSGETDIDVILDKLLEHHAHDDALAESIGAVIKKLAERQGRIKMRADAIKRSIGDVLSAAGLKKAERPIATVSVRPGNLSVRITDEADIPSQLMREKITRSPDKTAIKAQLEAGESVPGAELARGDDIVTLRTA